MIRNGIVTSGPYVSADSYIQASGFSHGEARLRIAGVPFAPSHLGPGTASPGSDCSFADTTGKSLFPMLGEVVRHARPPTGDGGGRGLYGVVNNAGILVIARLIEATEKQVADVFDVNVFGAYRITKAIAPCSSRRRWRVVNISSLNGIMSQRSLGCTA